MKPNLRHTGAPLTARIQKLFSEDLAKKNDLFTSRRCVASFRGRLFDGLPSRARA